MKRLSSGPARHESLEWGCPTQLEKHYFNVSYCTVRFCATKESAHLVPFDLVIWTVRVVRKYYQTLSDSVD